ncbi:MAG: arylesterase [Planctomycetes bacterium]|nr:arylesterase [Planctomycetota bacterium]
MLAGTLSAALLLGVFAACSEQPKPVAALPGERPAAEAEAPRAAVELEVPTDAPRVVFLGDSIAAGLHLSADQAFPAALQRELARRGVPFELVNAGVSGDTTAGGLRRVDWVLAQKPAVLVVELGANDGLRGQPVDALEANLRGIVRRAKELGVRVLLLGVRLPPSLGEAYVASFEAVYPELAESEGVAFVPYFMEGVGGVREMTLEDGIHPNVAGHDRIAQNVADELAKLLQESR